MKILVTGSSSGLGKCVAQVFAQNQHDVYGISRSLSSVNLKKQVVCDFLNISEIKNSLSELLQDTDEIDYVFLNAGTLGELSKINNSAPEQSLDHYKINVLSNKILLDFLISKKTIGKVICVSTGAINKSYYGWGLYTMHKACLKKMIDVYAEENPKINFLSLAPGLVKTKMQDYIYGISTTQIPSVGKFKEAYKNMQKPEECANKIYKNLKEIFESPKDRFTDLRDI